MYSSPQGGVPPHQQGPGAGPHAQTLLVALPSGAAASAGHLGEARGSGCGPDSHPCSSPCLPPSGSQFPEGTPPVPSPVSSGSWGICLPSFLGPKQGSSGRPRLSGEGLDLRGLGLGHGDGGPGPSCWPQPRLLSSAFNCCPSVFQVADSGPWPPGPGLHEGSVGRGCQPRPGSGNGPIPCSFFCPTCSPALWLSLTSRHRVGAGLDRDGRSLCGTVHNVTCKGRVGGLGTRPW